MIKEKIISDLKSCMKFLKLEYNENFTVETPKNTDHGDLSTNIALVSSKLNRANPRIIAEKIAEKLVKKRDYKKVEVAGPGFVNFTLANSILHAALQTIVSTPNYGASDFGKKEKILIEFISANPTGPLNIVSARAAAYGDTLCRIMNYVGFHAIREFYINDAGNQVDILAESLELRFREILGENIGEFPLEAYHGEYVKELAHLLNSTEGSKLLHFPEKDRLERIKKFALKEIHSMQVNSLTKFDVNFDSWVSERALRSQGILEEALSYLAEKGYTYESEEAVWFASSQLGDEKDRVLIKSDGNPTYLVPDIAYHLTKFQRGHQTLIDVLGPDHHGYVPRLKAAINALGYDENALEVVFLQQVNLFEDGEQVKMSKRAGKIVTMDELIDDVGKDAARFFFINRKPSAHLNFDLELAKKKSSENPVFYCQYAYARISSIIEKAENENITITTEDINLKLLRKLNKPNELLLIKKMISLGAVLNLIAEKREPHHLAEYTHELATMFHKYYQKHKVVTKKSRDTTKARLYLISAVKKILAITFDLMGISAPEKM